MYGECDDCVYFRAFPIRHCRRRPPTLFLLSGPQGVMSRPEFPVVPPGCGCGDYEQQHEVKLDIGPALESPQDLTPPAAGDTLPRE
jgi:hypothetical protein